MKILLFGGSGQLGFEIIRRARDLNFEVIYPVTAEVNVTEVDQVRRLAHSTAPNIIVNSAAYTAVDKAESDQDACFAINRDGAENVARAAKEVGCRLVHISTDYVYDGKFREPIEESAETAPVNVYGKSKLEGERRVQEIWGERSLIIRTSSLHGQKGVNFVHTMLNLFEKMPEVKVVSDQIMSPTWAGWLAEVILDLARMDATGLFHATSRGAISWYDFASAIYSWAAPTNAAQFSSRLEKTSTAEFSRPAKRPEYSVLSTKKLAAALGRDAITWEAGLKNHLRDIGRLKND